MSTSISPTGGPLIHEFNTSSYSVKKGEPFALSWRVEGADKIELYRNGVPYQPVDLSQTSVTRAEFQDSNKDVYYELHAYRRNVLSKSNRIVIRLAGVAGPVPPYNQTLLVNAFWAKFLAITGIVSSLLTILIIMSLTNSNGGFEPSGFMLLTVVILLMVVLPMILLLRFARWVQTEVVTTDPAKLAEAFQRLKVFFRYSAIAFLIFVSLVLIVFVYAVSQN